MFPNDRDGWSETLTCPSCASADVGILADECSHPRRLNGAPAGEWKMPGMAVCRHCKAEFLFESEVTEGDR
jgi:hypothetical protein